MWISPFNIFYPVTTFKPIAINVYIYISFKGNKREGRGCIFSSFNYETGHGEGNWMEHPARVGDISRQQILIPVVLCYCFRYLGTPAPSASGWTNSRTETHNSGLGCSTEPPNLSGWLASSTLKASWRRWDRQVPQTDIHECWPNNGEGNVLLPWRLLSGHINWVFFHLFLPIKKCFLEKGHIRSILIS